MKQRKIVNFTNILNDILEIAKSASVEALKSINKHLVIRNWLIGKRIHEQIITNRSNDYGKHLIQDLSFQLLKYSKSFTTNNLHKYHKFYRLYPNIIKIDEKSKIREPLVPQCQIILPWTYYLILGCIQIFNLCSIQRRNIKRNQKSAFPLKKALICLNYYLKSVLL